MIVLHRSNRTEALVEALAAVVEAPPDDPFAAEAIVVQGAGMARWLGLELARRFGVWANPGFGFPRGLIDQAAQAVLGDDADGAARFEPESVRWAIAAALSPERRRDQSPLTALLQRGELAAYLRDDRGGGRLIALAGKLADLFDQYAIFRPDLVQAWERGADAADWQAVLWRAVVARSGGAHPTARMAALLAALQAGGAPAPPFPRRVSLFGLSTLPPLYVEVLVALARHVELHMFLLSPSDAYWGDLAMKRETLRARAAAGGLDAETLHLDDGHPLLISLGRVGRDFQQVLESRADYVDAACYVEPGDGSALALLQSDILALRRRAPAQRVAWRAGDDSLAIHACHAPMREVEVLHDQLAALFERDPSLAPHDVIVMAPSIDAYAPLLDAVFTSPDRPAIPFRIADRPARTTHDAIDAFLRALELVPGRLAAPTVLDLLGLEPVRARFNIAAEALGRLRRWVQESGIRWGADPAHRVAEQQPPCAQNTWRFGLDRLLLGVALPDADRLFADTLPYPDVEGDDAALLGRFASFVETLLRAQRELAEPRPVEAWRGALGALLGSLVAVSAATEHEHEAMLAALAELARRAGEGGFEAPLDLDTMRRLLAEALEQGGAPRGFLTGAVTCCQMVPMRTIPFRVVCLLGLSDGAFPRSRRPLGFDRMARRPRVGDRSPRDDDRYLFLEALLAARERLLITYVGRSVSDNTPLPPSAVVAELLDAVEATYALPHGARAALVTQHPLQPFSPRYFQGGEGALRSYAGSHFRGAAALLQEPRGLPPFVVGGLAAPPASDVDLDELVRCLTHPARWFLQRRLNLYLDDREGLLDDGEPGELDNLENWVVGDRLLGHAREHGDVAAGLPLLRGEGLLPLGAPGAHLVASIEPVVRALAADVAEPCTTVTVDLAIDGWRLIGALSDVAQRGLLAAQFSRIGGHHELVAWIRHLALSAVRPGVESLLVGRGKKNAAGRVTFRAVADPRVVLAELLRLYQSAHERPLRLFKKASRAYADERLGAKPAPLARALARARGGFVGGENESAIGDLDDAYVAQLWQHDVDAALGGDGSDGFVAVAETVYGPFLAHRSAT
ncbi:MAG: exodeoxyribonuclease V subunit gamma [Deltaproteobacteria bacterium]|nr:exodeoxyribonuclease V subunit gamma [Deltaproteobacteria bacterium]